MILPAPTAGRRRILVGRTPEEHAPARPDLIPLLDVIFSILACFAFLLVMSELRPDSLPVNLPAANAGGAGESPGMAPLDISFDAAERVVVDGEPIPIDGLEVALARIIGADPARPVRLRGDRAASHGLTTRILAAAAAAGAEQVEIAVQALDPEGT